MSITHICPIVGLRFYPPATLLIELIPIGFSLVLKPEPSNPYDPNAVQVWLDPAELSLDTQEAEEEALLRFGMEWTNAEGSGIAETGLRHIGHLAAKRPKGLLAPATLVGELAGRLGQYHNAQYTMLGNTSMPAASFVLG